MLPLKLTNLPRIVIDSWHVLIGTTLGIFRVFFAVVIMVHILAEVRGVLYSNFYSWKPFAFYAFIGRVESLAKGSNFV